MNTLARVAKILFEPISEWQAVKQERTTPFRLYLTYLIPLAAISPLSFSLRNWILTTRDPFLEDFLIGFHTERIVASSILHLVGIFVLASMVSGAAPVFSAEKDFRQALKLIAYASTPVWLFGVFLSSPLPSWVFLAIALLCNLYAAYLLYLGLPVLMRVPYNTVMAYWVFVAGGYLVLSWLIRMTAPYATDLMDLARQPLTKDTKVILAVLVIIIITATLVLRRPRANKVE